MKHRILDLLTAREGEFVSGEELSKLLGISRAGVWKHINSLKEEGYRIESQTRMGHRLEAGNGPISGQRLMGMLGQGRIGSELILLQEVSSTNDKAKELARSGAKDGTVIIAEIQTSGRGRRGRSWLSERGGAWMSVILRPNLALKDAACYTLLAGAAVAKAVNEVTGLKAGIKWPNDILVNHKKVGGILTEVIGEWQGVDFLIIGMGINSNIKADQLPRGSEAGSLSGELGHPVNNLELISSILRQLELLQDMLLAGGLATVLKLWREYAVCLNCPVVIKEYNREWSGESVDIAPDGGLIVKTAEGKQVTIYSGEVSLRGIRGGLKFK